MAERIFPLDAGRTAWSSTLAQAWEVTQTETASGRRRAICSQLYPKLTFSVNFPALSDAELNTLLGFYSRCKGTLSPFWYKDYGTRIEMQELTRNDDGKYQCFVNQGGYIIGCERVDQVRVYIDGIETLDFSVANGVITVPVATAKNKVLACYDYYWRVRFADSSLSITQTFTNINTVSVKLVTVR